MRFLIERAPKVNIHSFVLSKKIFKFLFLICINGVAKFTFDGSVAERAGENWKLVYNFAFYLF